MTQVGHYQQSVMAQPVMAQPVMVQPVMTQPPIMNQTTVVMNVPQQQTKQARGWSTGIFDCLEDIPSCLCMMCNPCYACHLSSKLGENVCLPICLPGSSWLIALRVKVRTENKITGSICDDCCMVTFCYQCVMCQLDREHDNILRNPEM